MREYTSTLGKHENRDLISRLKANPLGHSNIFRDVVDRKSVTFLFDSIPLEQLIQDPHFFVRRSIDWHNDNNFLRDIVLTANKIESLMGENFRYIEAGEIDVAEYCKLPYVPYEFTALWSSLFLLNGIQWLGKGIVNNDLRDTELSASAFCKSLRLLEDARIRSPEQVQAMLDQYQRVIHYAEEIIFRRVEFGTHNRMAKYTHGETAPLN